MAWRVRRVRDGWRVMSSGRFDGLWMDDDAGPVVRPFAVTGGRTWRRDDELDLIAVVLTAEVPMPDPATLGPEDERILELCIHPTSVAEVAVELALPVGVVRVLLGDLLERGLVEVHRPVVQDGRPDVRLLQEVIEGLRAL
ncbi:DUF742 domain-containing protein [Actinomadura viridis]|uniref:DUF742 domain-containing protein n=1 Tax=Actinomadura viridis TaxID=58110 RepID=UPI00368F283D